VVLVVDNFDSFTYNLVQVLGGLGLEVVVRRNDEVGVEEAAALGPDGILLSPGPCSPERSGATLAIARAVVDPGGSLAGIPVLGVCLGHQALGMATGADIRLAATLRHGKTSPVEHTDKGVFAGCPNPVTVVRYHSLTVGAGGLPDCWEVTARSLDDGEIMGMAHKALPVEGVQFHPESVLTEHGEAMLANWAKRLEGAKLTRNGS
jgi:anthranilate synthase/aminodeoxychorismate synthase-like glutamine amidotransferase